MSTGKWLAALFAAALMFVGFASPSHADQFYRKIPIYTGAAGDTTAEGMADSTDWKGTAAFQRMFLNLRPNKPCRVAIAVFKGDTVAAALDTTNTYVWPWRGPASTVAKIDTVAVYESIPPTAVQAGSFEAVYEFPAVAAGKWATARGRVIALRGTTGEWYVGRSTRIRLRVLTSYGAGVVTWTGNIEGYTP